MSSETESDDSSDADSSGKGSDNERVLFTPAG